MNFKNKLLALFLLFVCACAQKPTLVSESYPILIKTEPQKNQSLQRVLKSEYSLVDIRKPFDQAGKSQPGSVPLWWEDETFRDERGQRYFDSVTKLAERWSDKGMHPNKPVILIHDPADKKSLNIVLCLFRQFEFKEIYPISINDIRSLNVSSQYQVEEAPFWNANADLDLNSCLKF